jgi:hypothetical protein
MLGLGLIYIYIYIYIYILMVDINEINYQKLFFLIANSNATLRPQVVAQSAVNHAL